MMDFQRIHYQLYILCAFLSEISKFLDGAVEVISSATAAD
jgi:hypothetical protein